MKKLLTIIIFLLAFTISYAQEKSSSPPVDTLVVNQVERIIDKYSEKVYNTLSGIMTQLKGPAEYIFKSAIKVNIATGIVNLVPLFFFVIFFIIFIHYCKVGKWEYGNPEDYKATLAIITGLISLGLLVASVIYLCSAIPYLVAPEWYAIKDIIHLIT